MLSRPAVAFTCFSALLSLPGFQSLAPNLPCTSAPSIACCAAPCMCGGPAMCEQHLITSRREHCEGSSTGEHNRLRSRRKSCGGQVICEHDRRTAGRVLVPSRAMTAALHASGSTEGAPTIAERASAQNYGGRGTCEHDSRGSRQGRERLRAQSQEEDTSRLQRRVGEILNPSEIFPTGEGPCASKPGNKRISHQHGVLHLREYNRKRY